MEDFKFTIIGNTRKERTIEEIVNGEDKTLMGIASGIDINHCFYIASRHYNNFLNDVKYYRICSQEESLDTESDTTIEFYK